LAQNREKYPMNTRKAITIIVFCMVVGLLLTSPTGCGGGMEGLGVQKVTREEELPGVTPVQIGIAVGSFVVMIFVVKFL
jgi:hypothetical protein